MDMAEQIQDCQLKFFTCHFFSRPKPLRGLKDLLHAASVDYAEYAPEHCQSLL